ncbi:DUF6434 domain-containing protein [Algoriphagus pacificus]|uniref:DUF6434 domain-containing protein n=1 Tax=Algoriphagus pacificus TaxID=2811234 RepID=A0ABS3CBU3_9BACT|nr:DUF6434 domain-containing protein [Algoriphagus pacificus]MBN7814579.1 hypothetical protein [Algoriphagus pacificus]
MGRPDFESIKSGEEFNKWYWLKEEMVAICKSSGLPSTGRKFDLRDRIMHALDNNGELKAEPKKQNPRSKFNWAKADLSLETKITDNVSFGPNFRTFMKSQIGNSFSCTSDFMDWVKENEGKTLENAIQKYHQLEKRKEDPNFERKIADNNMFNQYTRDFLKDNPEKNIDSVRKYWMLKKQLPTKDGFVRYEKSDLNLEEM